VEKLSKLLERRESFLHHNMTRKGECDGLKSKEI